MSNANRIHYRIQAKSSDNTNRLYTIYLNDPIGEITRMINNKEKCSFVCDFVAETITPSGYGTSTDRHKMLSIRFNLKAGEEIRVALANFSIKNDVAKFEEDNVKNQWKAELLEIAKQK